MYCTHCGANCPDDSAFCTNCGAPLSNTREPSAAPRYEPRPDRQKIPAASTARPRTGRMKKIALFGLLPLGVFALVLAALLHFFPASEEPGSGKPSQAAAKDADADGFLPAAEKDPLSSYYRDVLVPELGEFDWGTYDLNYGNSAEGSNLEGASGIVFRDIRDYDADEQDELFIMLLDEGHLELQMYEADENDSAALSAQMESLEDIPGFGDIKEHNYYIKSDGGTIYLAEDGYSTVSILADGTSEFLRVSHYAGGEFVSDVSELYEGSDFSGLEDEVAQTASELNACGFTESAARLDVDLVLQAGADNLDPIFLVRACNADFFSFSSNPQELWEEFYNTQNYDVLGQVEYHFFPNEEKMREFTQILGYHTERNDFSVSEGDETVTAYFDQVIFEGNGSSRIDWLNRQVESLKQDYYDSTAPYLEEELGLLKERNESFSYQESGWDYMPHDLESVYYDDRGWVSIGYSWHWYMGGVANSGWVAMNYNLTNCQPLYLPDVLNMDWLETSDAVLEALAEEDPYLAENARGSLIPSDLSFYFDEANAYICFDAYSLNQGGSGIQITIPRQ